LQYVNIHTHFSSGNVNHIEILNLLPQEEIDFHQYFSCGIHPWFIQSNWENQIVQLRNKLSNTSIIAIGECGIDKFKGPDIHIQQDVFLKQIKLANEFNLPLIIHNVKSQQEILKLLKDIHNREKVIFHGFNNSLTIANQIINAGCFLSFGKALFNPDSNAAKVLKTMPYEKFFLETDDNMLHSIEEVYTKASEILNIPLQKLKEDLFLRFKAIFKKA
jgi:TatD DNase family protein